VKPGLVEGVFQNVLFLTTFNGFRMNFLVLEALVSIALALSALMATAWLVQQRTGNPGWIDPVWTSSLGLVGAGSAPWPAADVAPETRQWLVAVAVRSPRVGITGIPPLEQRLLRWRGDRFRDDQLLSGRFFPLPPRNRAVR
jgi:steroid 5-alpha reductase family enzyme